MSALINGYEIVGYCINPNMDLLETTGLLVVIVLCSLTAGYLLRRELHG